MLDKFYRMRYKILGGPGCGKTTEILKILSDNIKGGLQVEQALLLGFAKATVETLQKRAVEENKLTAKQAESITTIHKYCYERIGKPDVLNSSAKTSFRKKIQTDPDNWVMLDDENYNTDDDEPAAWTEKEDKKLAIYHDIISKAQHNHGYDKKGSHLRFRKNRKYEGKDDLEKILNFFGESENDKWKNVLTPQLVYFYSNFYKFKNQNGFADFDDMLLKALQPKIEFPSYKLVLVDEVQDLSFLEWQVISKIGKKTEELYLVGDDDQAIYGWKGSDVEIFQKWPCKKENIKRLKTSFRLPGKIYDFALNIRENIKYRMGNEFNCEKRIDIKIKNEGSIDYIYDMSELDEEIDVDSDVIFCARINKYCQNYAYFLKDKGLIFKEKAKTPGDRGKLISSFPSPYKKVIESWNTLQEGHSIKGTDYVQMVKSLNAKFISERKKTALINKHTAPPDLYDTNNLYSYVDLKTKYYLNADINKLWHEIFYFDTKRVKSDKKPNALFKDKEDFNDYLKRCWEKNKNLETKIIVSSIHGVKGMEADKVVLGVEWGYSLNSYMSGDQKREDEENRVAYVGVTRCKNKLYLFEISGDYKNPFPPLRNYVNNSTPDNEKIKEKEFNKNCLDSFHKEWRPDWNEIENPINNDRRTT